MLNYVVIFYKYIFMFIIIVFIYFCDSVFWIDQYHIHVSCV